MLQENFMQRCLQLAELGRGKVAPNPMVGCVIVHKGVIIGEGWHHEYGGPHAEVNAIHSVVNPSILNESTVFVSLEPCAHFGKTPPCANLLVKHDVKKVVVGCLDSYAEVAGKGISILRNANIEVEVGLLEKECRKLNQRFFTFHENKRPYIILKWAETKDGFIAGKKKIISGSLAQAKLHQWRTEEVAFMIGTHTLLEDNPQMNVRYWEGKDPIRIAIDFNLKSKDNKYAGELNFYDQTQETIVLNGVKNEKTENLTFVKIDNCLPQTICHALFRNNIQSVVIEGGAALLQSFIDAQLVDEIRVFKSKEVVFSIGLKAPVFEAKEQSTEDLDTDILTIYSPN